VVYNRRIHFLTLKELSLRTTLEIALLLALLSSLGFSTSNLFAQARSNAPDEALTMLGTLRSKKISESSGLATSHFLQDAFWTINDSGHGTNVYLFGNRGQTLAQCELKKTKNRDWEAMSSFQRNGKHYLMVADVGDNVARRQRCQLYIFEEPKFEPRKKKSFSKKLKNRCFDFRFDDGPRNCEAVASTPDGESVFLIEKIFLETAIRRQPGIYQLKLNLDEVDNEEEKEEALLVAKRIASFPFRGVTGMSISPDGKRLAIRNYLSAHLFERVLAAGEMPSWEQVFNNSKPKTLPMPLQVQGEAICFTNDNEYLIVTSETVRQPIWKVRIASEKESRPENNDSNSESTTAIEEPATPLKTTKAQ